MSLDEWMLYQKDNILPEEIEAFRLMSPEERQEEREYSHRHLRAGSCSYMWHRLRLWAIEEAEMSIKRVTCAS